MLEIQSVLVTKIAVSEIINNHLRIDKSHTRVTFGVDDLLAVPVFLKNTFIDCYIKLVHSAEKKSYLTTLH